jgi:tetratricopeptide (TPR) repeat protein
LRGALKDSYEAPVYLSAYDCLAEASPDHAQALAGLSDQWRAEAASSSPDAKTYRLLAEMYRLQGSAESLTSLSQSAIEHFPLERRFYEDRASAYRALGRFDELNTLYKKEMATLSDPRAEDYVHWSNAFIRVGELQKADEILQRGMNDRRLAANDASNLRAWRDAWIREAGPGQCQFPEDEKTISIRCPDGEVTYSMAAGAFSFLGRPATREKLSARESALAADLERRLMEHVETVRLIDSAPYFWVHQPQVPRIVYESLRQAGYLP